MFLESQKRIIISKRIIFQPIYMCKFANLKHLNGKNRINRFHWININNYSSSNLMLYCQTIKEHNYKKATLRSPFHCINH